MKKKPKIRWTRKHERFCLLYVKCGSASAAYREAFESKATEKSVNEISSRLLDDVKVQSRIRALRERAAELANVSLASHILALGRLRDKAVTKGQISAAVSAEKARGEVCGFYTGVRNPLSDPKPVQPDPEVQAPEDDEVARALLVLQKAERQAAGKRKGAIS